MKRILWPMMLAVCLLSALCLSGCGQNKPDGINHTSEILINEEAFPSDLVWFSHLSGPASGTGILPVPPYRTDATVGADGICEARVPQTEKKLQDLLGLNDETYARDFGSLSWHEYCKYEDTELICFQVDENAENNGQPVTHAGKRMIAERCGDAVYITDITDIVQSSGELSTSYDGRIGSKYYLEYGYYDLNTHEAKAYTHESELPLAKHESYVVYDYSRLNSLLKEHEIGSAYFEDVYCVGVCQLGNRLYVVMASRNRYREGTDENGNFIYEGEDVYLVTLNTETDEILYLQKYHLTDYFGDSYRLFQQSSDGELLTPMVDESTDTLPVETEAQTPEETTETPTEEITEPPTEAPTEPVITEAPTEGVTYADETVNQLVNQLRADGYDMEKTEFSDNDINYAYKAVVNARIFREGEILTVTLSDLVSYGEEVNAKEYYELFTLRVWLMDYEGKVKEPIYLSTEDCLQYTITAGEDVRPGVYYLEIYLADWMLTVCPIVVY